MKMFTPIRRASLSLAPLFLCGLAHADFITPDVFSTTLTLGGSTTINKVVTIEATGTQTATLDVVFLFDTTGSMGSLLTDAKNNANAIMDGIDAFGDVRYGVADYRDFVVAGTSWGSTGDYPFALKADLGTKAGATTAINSLFASGGNDIPESNLYALQQTAEQLSWRPGSNRIVIWFGDARGHDPDTTTGYPGPTLATTILALTDKNIIVNAINFPSGPGLDQTGQATAITTATGGEYFPSGASGDDLVTTIQDAITTNFATYSSVTLDLSEVPAGVTVVATPTSPNVGMFDRSIDRTFSFDVTFTGDAEGIYQFPIFGLVDGGRVAVELDYIAVVPEPATIGLLAVGGLFGLVIVRRRMLAKK